MTGCSHTGEIRAGWYLDTEEWYLTWTALQKEFKLKSYELALITATTQYGGVNQGELKTASRINFHNDKRFIVYNFEDMKKLIEKMKK